jgi:hypothetical protein
MKRLETGKIKCDDDWSGIFIAGGEYKLLFFNTGVKQVSEIPAYYKGSIQTYIDGVLSLFDEGFVTINKVKNDN